MKEKKIARASVLLALQWGSLSVVYGLVIALVLQLESGAAYSVAMWAVLPLLGACAAFFVTRKGLNYFAAWIAPPVCVTAIHWVLTGFPPSSAGIPIVAAALSMVAASTAEVMRERKK